jgi:uncharacterized protein (TIGR02217 family)
MGISFQEVQFPPFISQGAVGGPRFSTSIQTLSSGYEHRNINWSRRRGEWDVSTGLKTQKQIEALLDFFHARNGKAFGFRYKDWSDYRLPRWYAVPGDLFPFPVFFTTNGTVATFQLVKVYGDAGGAYVRLIQKPVAGSYAFFNNGAPMEEGTDFTIDITTGIVTLSAAITATADSPIAGYTEFDVPARFDTDDMKITTTTTDNFAWGPVPIVEIRDIA